MRGISSQSAFTSASLSDAFISVFITPGATQFTVTPDGPVSCANAFVKPMTAALEAEYCEKEQGLETRKQELESQYEKNVNAMEGDIVDAVIQVFDKVFHIQFENKREILYSLVKNVLLDIEVGDEIRIHVNEENREIIEAHMDEIREIVGQKVAIEFVHDAKLKDDQCKIETSFGVFDCGIDTQLDNLLKDIKSLV